MVQTISPGGLPSAKSQREVRTVKSSFWGISPLNSIDKMLKTVVIILSIKETIVKKVDVFYFWKRIIVYLLSKGCGIDFALWT